MTKYRKKPVIIEAFQYDGDMMDRNGWYVPMWAADAYREGILFYKEAGELYIKTLEGEMHVPVGNYIIRGIKSELYSCRPEIFRETYEEVE